MLLESLLKLLEGNRRRWFVILMVVLATYLLSMLFFRFPMHDETLYLHETIVMSEVLKEGKWIGDFGVGLHGFIFKLPLALVFIITGPSVAIATIFYYILAIISLYITYLVSNEVFKDKELALISTLLFAFSFEFIRSAPTYLREIPSVLTVLLFVYGYLKSWNKWVIGLLMLLILDAKEYMFFITAFAYVITQLVLWFKVEKKTLNQVMLLIADFIKVFLPSIIYLLLMFTTSVIPVNMFIASILGLIDKGLKWNAQQFSVNSGTSNVVNSGDLKEIFNITYRSGIYLLDELIKYINILLNYVGKFLYPRSFSYISIPKIILIPSLIVGFFEFKKYLKVSDKKIIIFILLITFLSIFMLRSSHGRYLFSISPLIFILFLQFLSDLNKNIKLSIIMISVAWIFEVLGLFFETTWEIPKMVISFLVLLSFIITLFLNIKFPKYNKLYNLLSSTLLMIILFGSSLTYLYTQGQIFYSLKFGREFEIQKIVSHLNKYQYLIINDTNTGQTLPFYLSDSYRDPLWKWNLKSWIPKSNLVKTHNQKNVTISHDFSDEEIKNKQNTLVLFDSKYKSIGFEFESLIPRFLNDPNYALIEKIELVGKDMYIFKYNGSNN